MHALERGLKTRDVVGGNDDSGSRLPDQRRRRAVGRDRGENRALGRQVLEDLAAEDTLPSPVRFGDEQEERLRVALEAQGLGARRVLDQLEALTQAELLGPLAVGRAEVAHEAGDRVEPGVVERLEERARVPLPEEAAGVGDAETRPGAVLEAHEVVEVAAVRDRADDAPRRETVDLLRDRVGDGRDPVGVAGDEPPELDVRRLLGARAGRVGTPVRVGDQRIPDVRQPACARGALDRGADEVDRPGRRGR